MRPIIRLSLSVVLSSMLASTPAAAAPLGFPVPGAAPAPAPTVAGVLGALDGMTARLHAASFRLGRAEHGVLLALGLTGEAQSLLAEIQRLEATSAAPERDDAVRQVVADPRIPQMILARAADQAAVAADAVEALRAADGERFGAALQVALLAPEVASLSLQFVTLGQRILGGDASLIAEIAVTAMSPKAFVASVTERFERLGGSARAFGEQNKAVGEAMKALYKAKKVTPPDYKAVEASVRSNAF